MKVHITFSTLFCASMLMVGVGCRKETKAREVAASQPQQDTMLLRDLAEANRNTAAASALDNSLNTVRTSSDGLSPLVDQTSSNRPTDRANTRPQPPGSEILTSGPRLPVPTKANDASAPTTVPLD